MDMNSRVRIGVSLNNVTGITGKTYELADLIRAGIEDEAMGFDLVGCMTPRSGVEPRRPMIPSSSCLTWLGRPSR